MPAHQLAAVLESIDEAVMITSLDNVIQSWNPAAERIYGYTPEEVIGRPLSMLLAPERMADAEERIHRIARGEFFKDIPTLHVARDGRLMDVVLSISPIRDSDGEIRSALRVVRTTELEQVRRALDHANLDVQNRVLIMETASRVALDILSSRTGIEALRHIAEAARVLAGARYAALGVASPDGDGLVEFVTVGLTPPEEAVIGPRPTGEGVLGLLLRRTQPLRIARLSSHSTSVGFPPNHPPMDSFLGVPIRRGATVLGSLYLTNKEGAEEFTESDEAAVEALGAHAAVAIHNLHMLLRQRDLVRGLITAQEEERRAIAYDLHDGLTQYVMASHAHLEAFRRAHAAGREDRAEREMAQGLKHLKDAVVESRRLVNGLRSLALDDLGLTGALELLVSEERDRAGWEEAEFIQNIDQQRFDKMLETAIYRVVQEALTNARRHADTPRVRVSLVAGQDDWTGVPNLAVEIRDWGQGFIPEQRIGAPGHVGMQGMIERVSLFGGSYDIRSAPGEGTVIRAVFPILEPAPEDTTGDNR